MAYPQIKVDGTKPWGQKELRFREALLELVNKGRELQGKMVACIDADADPDDYANMGTVFGTTTADAEALKGEHDSLMFKLDTDAQVDSVKTAIANYCNKVG